MHSGLRNIDFEMAVKYPMEVSSSNLIDESEV